MMTMFKNLYNIRMEEEGNTGHIIVMKNDAMDGWIPAYYDYDDLQDMAGKPEFITAFDPESTAFMVAIKFAKKTLQEFRNDGYNANCIGIEEVKE